jgi:hypothetical protein
VIIIGQKDNNTMKTISTVSQVNNINILNFNLVVGFASHKRLQHAEFTLLYQIQYYA